jgi:phage recombination protein Bet
MSDKQIVKKENVYSLMAAKYNLNKEEFKETIKATLMPKDRNGNPPKDEQIVAFLVVAHQYNLNPFTNEIYAYPDKKGGITPVVGIDGFSAIINHQPDYDGMDIEFSKEETTLEGAKKCPEWCEVKIYKKNTSRPIVAREYLDEVYVPPRSGFNGPWQTHTKRMLRHKAIIQAARIAFGITGIYDEDEAQRIKESQVIETNLVTAKPDVEIPREIESSRVQYPVISSTSPEPKINNAQRQIIDNLLKAKKKIGEEAYYKILGDAGFENENEISIQEGMKLLSKMKEVYEQRKNEEQ